MKRLIVDLCRLRGSPVVWRILLELEIRDGQLERAKKMLFRAVAECPLCKGASWSVVVCTEC